jgi:hypothetical protein
MPAGSRVSTRKMRCEAQTGKLCPAGKHWTPKCRCMTNERKKPMKKNRSSSKSITQNALRDIMEDVTSDDLKDAATREAVAKEIVQGKEQAKVERGAKLEKKQGARVQYLERILGRPIASPSQLTESDTRKIEKYEAEEQQKLRQARGVLRRLSNEAAVQMAPAGAQVPVTKLFETSALDAIFKDFGYA